MRSQHENATQRAAGRVVPRPFYLVLALGELARLLALALLVSDRFFPEANGPAGIAAWLVLILSPHAVVASGLVAMSLRLHTHPLTLATILPAKTLSVAATLVALVSEIATGSPGALHLITAAASVPDSLVLAALYAWDLAVLVVVIQSGLRARRRRPAPAGRVAAANLPGDVAGPVLHVENVDAGRTSGT